MTIIEPLTRDTMREANRAGCSGIMISLTEWSAPVLHIATLPALLLVSLVTLVVLSQPLSLSAQQKQWTLPDWLPRYHTPYNFEEREFITGLLFNKPMYSPVDSVGTLWEIARWYNASDWIWTVGLFRPHRGEDERLLQLDTLLTSARPGERLTIDIDPIMNIAGAGLGGNGQMMEFYPFDSSQSPFIRWQFVDVDDSKGELAFNDYYDNTTPERRDWPWDIAGPRERHFVDPEQAGLIAEHAAVRYDSQVARSWSEHLRESDPEGVFLNYAYSTTGDSTLYVALKGHLLDADGVDTRQPSGTPARDGSVSLDDAAAPVFTIALYHVILPGREYRDDRGMIRRAARLTEIPIDSITVTRADFITDQPLAAYRDISFPVDLRYRFGDTTLYGPMHPDRIPFSWGDHSGSRNIDVRVYWTGEVPAALRSVMLRNSRANEIYTGEESGMALRQGMVNAARRLLHGLDTAGQVDLKREKRDAILSFDSGHEPHEFGLGAFRAVHRVLNDSLVYRNSSNGFDSIDAGIIIHNPSVHLHNQYVAGSGLSHIEYHYMNFWRLPDSRQKTPFDTLPSIAEHNGGRVITAWGEKLGPPLLNLTRDSIELYTESLQRRFYGFYTPEPDRSGYAGVTVPDVGAVARTSRLLGIPFIGIAGMVGLYRYDTANVRSVAVPVDTIRRRGGGTDSILYADSLISSDYLFRITHQPEASELRFAANLALCYGARGLSYYWLGTNLDPIGDNVRIFPASADTLMWGERDMSLMGEMLEIPTQDRIDLPLHNHAAAGGIRDAIYHDTIPDVWTGWKSRSEAVRDINLHTDLIGTFMAERGIRWRDAYSIHHQSVRPNSSEQEKDFPAPRPLGQHEIVRGVTATNPITGQVDPPWSTFVELGLFYTLFGRDSDNRDGEGESTDVDGDSQSETNYLYILNRRTFARPPDISATSPRGRLMDSLAENRLIRIDFNLDTPSGMESGRTSVTTPSRMVRLREINPVLDTIPFVGIKQPLDTLIEPDGSVEVLLAPGAGTLIEISRAKG